MSDLPIKLDFFKKLELYQEMAFQDKKASTTDRKDWYKIKKFLAWTSIGHHHLDSPINSEYVYRYVYEDQFRAKKTEILDIDGNDELSLSAASVEALNRLVLSHISKDIGDLQTTFGTMRQMGYAVEGSSFMQIKFTPLGLLMGRVIYEYQYENNIFRRIKYPFFIILTWLTIISAAFFTIYTGLKIVWEFLLNIRIF